MATPQNFKFSSPKLAQLEPLWAFDDTIVKTTGFDGIRTWVDKTGLQLLLLPATQTTWKQKGLALDKPFILQIQPGALACMGVADSKALATTINALPGDIKTTQKGTLHYRIVSTGPQHNFVFFWNLAQLCVRPSSSSSPPPSLYRELDETLTKTMALLKTAAKLAWPVAVPSSDLQIQIEPVSADRLKLRLNLAPTLWELKAAKERKTVLASVSTDTGVLLKFNGVPVADILKKTDFVAALSPKDDAMLDKKQAWFAQLSPLLANEFLAKMDYPDGRNSERFLLVAKLNPDSEVAFDTWLSQMPQADAATNTALLPTRRGPLVLARKDAWAFAATHKEQALAHIEQLEKATPATAPPFTGLVFPKTLGAFFQGETFISAMMGLSRKQTRLLMFNLPLKNLANTLEFIKAEAQTAANHSTELFMDISLGP